QVEQFRDTPFPVLIEGASGTGKELVARALHEDTSRAAEPYLVINCAAMSAQLIEAQLFGHTKGAFTGATAAKAGFFEEADNGTLCLDEVGELPLELQAKLLRVLENGEFYRIGETQVRHSSARVVAATNRDLRTEVAEGRFREDLFHRLSVFRIQVPPLSDRGDDRLILLNHFNEFYSAQLNTRPFQLNEEALALWRHYGFPGNIRELKNIVVRLSLRLAGSEASGADLRNEFEIEQEIRPPETATTDANPLSSPLSAESVVASSSADFAHHLLTSAAGFKLDEVLREWEGYFIQAALKEAGGNLSKAARRLGINRTTLYSRVQKYPELQPGTD
ncbi:MAG: sigma-54-dependent Fis family transcriptional regulator, partial [Gammaproteobacteria bacterium]